MKDETRKLMRKKFALLLAVIMCFGTLAACGNNGSGGDDVLLPPAQTPPLRPPEPTPENPDEGNTGDNGTPGGRPEGAAERQALAEQYGLPYDSGMDEWEPVTFTYFTRSAYEPPAADNPILKIVEQITNVRIDFQFIHTDLEVAAGVMAVVGDMPDMAYFGNYAAIAIDSGYLMPIDELIEQYAPGLRAHYDPWWELMRHTDGRIYTAEIYGTPVGTQTIMQDDKSAFWIQKDVLDHFGRIPADIDEYFDFIREYKELNPRIDGRTTIGFSIENNAGRNFGVVDPGYYLAGNADWGGAINTDGNLLNAAISPAERWTADFNKSWWKKLNEEFHMGTFTSRTFNLTHDDYLAQIATGAVLGMFDKGWNIHSAEQLLIEEGRYERTYLPLALTYPGVEPNYLDAIAFTGSNGINISAEISDPVRAIQYLDWIIDESVQRFLSWGIEGEHYYYDDNGRIARTQEQRELQRDKRWTYDNLGRMLLEMMPKKQGTYLTDGNPTGPDQSPEEYFAELTGYDRDLFEKLGIYTMTGFWGEPKQRPVYYPYRNMQPEEDTDAQNAARQIENVLRGRTIVNMITGREDAFETRWEAYIEAINAIDQNPIMDFFTEEAERRMTAPGS